MSAVIAISAGRRYGVARVCRAWGVSRSSLYRGRMASPPAAPRRRPRPQGPMPDAGLVEAIRQTLADSPFHGEGYRKVWARLRHAGLRTSKERVRRLMREHGLSATTRTGRPRGPRSHDGTIIPETIDTMWGTDMTAAFTVDHGQVAVFVAVDHASAECVGVHAALHGTRHEALEPVRQGVAERFGSIDKNAADASRSVTTTEVSTCPGTFSARSPGSAPHPSPPSSAPLTDQAIGLVERFASCFTDGRSTERVVHDVATLVGQRVFGIALGYEDLIDHDRLRHDRIHPAEAAGSSF